MTFDYQFQKIGKIQQKCYCGSEKCRGFLGAASTQQNGGAFDHIWDESDEDSNEDDDENEDSDDEEEEEDSDEESDKENSDSELTGEGSRKRGTKLKTVKEKCQRKKHVNNVEREHKKKSSNKEDFEVKFKR